ncbi:MAG: ATP-binding protein [Burkholderiaceae bacterium]
MKTRFLKRWNRLGLFGQLSVAYGIAALGFFVLLTLVSLFVVGRTANEVAEDSARMATRSLAASLSRAGTSNTAEQMRGLLAQYQVIPGTRRMMVLDARLQTVTGFSGDGTPVAGFDPVRAPEVREARLVPTEQGSLDAWLLGPRHTEYWFPIGWQGFNGWLVIDRDVQHLRDLRMAVVRLLATSAVLLVLLTVLLAGGFGRWHGVSLQRLLDYLGDRGQRAFAGFDDLPTPLQTSRFATGLLDALREVKRLQQQAALAALRHEQLFRAHDGAALIIDEHGQILEANPVAAQMFGYSEDEFAGMHADHLVADSSMPRYRDWWQNYWTTGVVPSADEPERIRAIRRNRKEFDAELTLAPIKSGGSTEFAITYRDVTHLIADQTRLSAALAAAEAASRARNQFVATVSHELRTPMNGIIGMTDLAMAARPDPVMRDYLNTIRTCGRQMSAVIDDVLDVSRLDAGRLRLDVGPFEPAALLEEIRAVYMPIARHKRLRFELVEAENMPAAVLGDVVRIRQVLDHLLVNAFKFTEQGGVIVSCGVVAGKSGGVIDVAPGEQAGRQPMELVFSVSDSGVGIAANRQEAIFEAFTQADSDTSRRFGGSGLGLSLSRRLVQLMGGLLWVESRPGKGSTFHASIPCLAMTHEEALAIRRAPAGTDVGTDERQLAERFGALRVLVAEDSADSREPLVELLRDQGCEVIAANDGEAAMAAWIRQRPDLVITDLSMPGLSGLELTEKIRLIESQVPGRTPAIIVGLSASADAGTAQACLGKGMDDYLPKPLEPGLLLRRVAALIDSRQAGPAPGAGPAITGPTPAMGPPPRMPSEAPAPGAASSLWQAPSDGNSALMQRILKLAVKELPSRMNSLGEAVAGNDVVWVRRHAHSLVNTLQAVGQPDIVRLAREVEQHADAALPELQAHVEALDAAIRRLLPDLQAGIEPPARAPVA